MSYTPTEWKSGDIVTSEKLNKLEQGVASGGILVATVDGTTMTLDKTWKQLYDAPLAVVTGDGPAGVSGKAVGFVLDAVFVADTYSVGVFSGDLMRFTTDSEDGYPVLESQVHPSN